MALKYRILAEALKKEIAQRGPSGDRKLPTEAELAGTWHVSRQTVRQALSVLLDEGMIEKHQGSGTYIAPSVFPSAFSSGNIAFLLPDAGIYPATLNVSEAQSRFDDAGYSAQVYCTENRTAAEREILLSLLDKPVRGLIVQGTRTAFPNPNVGLYESLVRKGTSVIFLGDAYPELSGIPSVSFDDFSGGCLLARHLLSLGHKKIAGIFCLDNQSGHKRYAGVLHALCENWLMFDDRNFLWYDSLTEQTPDSSHILSFIRIQLTDCTAVICQNETIARQLIRELRHCNIPIPQRVSVVAFATSNQERQNGTHITCAVCPDSVLWKTAVENLLSMIEGKNVSSVSHPWRLREGSSTEKQE